MEAFKHLKIGKAAGPTEVYAEMFLPSGDVGIRVLIEHCQRILDEKGWKRNASRLGYQCCSPYFPILILLTVACIGVQNNYNMQ